MAESESQQHRVRIESLDILVQQVVADLKTRSQTPELPTGLPMLDEAIWGLHRNEVTVIAARPGEGKTTLALQIGLHLADEHKKVLFVSLEMTRHQLTERILVQLTQFDAWNLRTGVKLEEFLEKLAPLNNGFFKDLNLRLVDGFGYTIPQLQHLLNQMVKEGGGPPDVLIVDFIQLIAPEGLQKFDAISEYLRSLKELAMRYNMAILICSQVNREGVKQAKQRPKLEHLKGSGAIEELADCVIICWWQELGTEENPQGTKYWLCIEKQRHGSPGQMISVRFDKNRLTFHSTDETVAEWHDAPAKAAGDVVLEDDEPTT